MRLERIIYSLLIIAASALAAINWRRAALFQQNNEEMRAHIADLETEAERKSNEITAAAKEAQKNRAQTSELLKLRNEVTQLRTASKSVETLTAENQRLRAENQTLRTGANSAPTEAPAPTGFAGRDQFPRNSWAFAGYSSPEAALVSAIWSMKQGDPKTYLDSLSPDEQKRVATSWQGKAETEIADKHKSDVAAISGLRVLDRQSVSPNEMIMNVYVEGPNRVEKVRMNQVGQDWKFGGFIRDQQPQPPAAAAPAQ